MTIKDYLDAAKTGAPALAMTTDVWSNAACAGYCIAAAHSIDLPADTVAALLDELQRAFDTIPVEDAEEIYNQY